MEKRSHSLDVLFPLGLLAVFVLSAVMVILLSAQVYRGTTEKAETAESGTALNYITEKIHQGDLAESVSVGEISGLPALILSRGTENAWYDTYIYCYDGALRELMVNRELPPTADMGRPILSMDAFSVEAVRPGLLRLRCTDSRGNSFESYVNFRPGEERQWS